MSNKEIFEITGIKLVGSYIFDLPKNEECTICRTSLHAASIYNQEKGLDSYVVSGVCGHSYHNECIKSWIEKNNYCPICFVKWEANKKEIYNTNKISPLISIINKINDLDENKINDNVKKTINIINSKMDDNNIDNIITSAKSLIKNLHDKDIKELNNENFENSDDDIDYKYKSKIKQKEYTYEKKHIGKWFK